MKENKDQALSHGKASDQHYSDRIDRSSALLRVGGTVIPKGEAKKTRKGWGEEGRWTYEEAETGDAAEGGCDGGAGQVELALRQNTQRFQIRGEHPPLHRLSPPATHRSMHPSPLAFSPS